MHVYKTSDGYTFYEQQDGSYADSQDKENADMVFDSLEDLLANTDAEQVDTKN